MLKSKWKMIVLVIVSIIVIASLCFKGWVYYKYYQIYNDIKENDISALYKAEKIDISVKTQIEGYTEFSNSWFSVQTPYGSINDFEERMVGEIPNKKIYTNAENNTFISIFNGKLGGDSFFDKDVVKELNDKFNTNIITSKDFYDAMYQKDYSNINYLSSYNKTTSYAILLVQRSTSTVSGKLYYFENANNYGYIMYDRYPVIRIFDQTGKFVSEIAITNGDEVMDLNIMKNIVGSIIIK